MSAHPLIGKRLVSITERSMAGNDTFGDVLTWTEATLVFEGGEEVSFGGPGDTEVYDVFEYDGWDENDRPVPVDN